MAFILAEHSEGLWAKASRAVSDALWKTDAQRRKEMEWVRVVVAAMPQDKLQVRTPGRLAFERRLFMV